jgi:hypothetical protein
MACVPVEAHPRGTGTDVVIVRVEWVPYELGVPPLWGAAGKAEEPPCPEHDELRIPTASAAAANLFINVDSSSNLTIRKRDSRRHTGN